MKKQHIFLTLLPFLIFTIMGASPVQKKAEESLRKRVEGLMQAKVDGKWDVVYTYYDTGFRKAASQENFTKRSGRMDFKSFTIESLEILPSGNEATVKLKTDISMQGFDFKGKQEKQHWIKQDGEWFQKVNIGANPFAPKKKK